MLPLTPPPWPPSSSFPSIPLPRPPSPLPTLTPSLPLAPPPSPLPPAPLPPLCKPTNTPSSCQLLLQPTNASPSVDPSPYGYVRPGPFGPVRVPHFLRGNPFPRHRKRRRWQREEWGVSYFCGGRGREGREVSAGCGLRKPCSVFTRGGASAGCGLWKPFGVFAKGGRREEVVAKMEREGFIPWPSSVSTK